MFTTPARYIKAYAGWIGGILSAVLIGAPAIGIQVPSWVALFTLVITAIAVQALPNSPAGMVSTLADDGAIINTPR